MSLTRQKKINRFNKHKKRFLRMREKINFEKIMATRLNDDSQDDLEFNDNSSVESEHDDIRYIQYIKAMKDNYNSGGDLNIDAKTGIEQIIMDPKLHRDPSAKSIEDPTKTQKMEGGIEEIEKIAKMAALSNVSEGANNTSKTQLI